MKDEKKLYKSPKLTAFGKVEEITMAGLQKGYLDGNYPRGTPSNPGLFS